MAEQSSEFSDAQILEVLRGSELQARMYNQAATTLQAYVNVRKRIGALEAVRDKAEAEATDAEKKATSAKAESTTMEATLEGEKKKTKEKVDADFQEKTRSASLGIAASKQQAAEWQNRVREARVQYEKVKEDTELELTTLKDNFETQVEHWDQIIADKKEHAETIKSDFEKWQRQHGMVA